jgi:hypothetical protein
VQAGGGATGRPGCPGFPIPDESAEPKVMGEALADDVHTATLPRGAVESRTTSPPVADSRVATPPCVVDARGVTSVGDIRVTTSPTIFDIDPISAVPGGAEDLVKDQPQIDLVPGGPGTSGAQVPRSSSSSPRLP